MSSHIKTIIKYLITLVIGVALLWYLVSRQSPEEKDNIVKGFQNADYTWIALTIIISVFEKVVRAYRWNLLMEPLQYRPPLRNTFFALMIAYFANIFAPRMGEVARCGILKKTDDVPINTSFGTVVAERVIDFLCLLLIIPVALVLEYQKISELLNRNLGAVTDKLAKNYWILATIAGVMLMAAILLYIKRATLMSKPFFIKIKEFGAGVWSSVLSIRKLSKRGHFIGATLLIWVCYFLMTYLAFFSLDATSNLTPSAGLVILVVGGLGMAAPVQGGIGAFHAIVKETLEEVYMIKGGWALPYAFVVHTTQTIAAFLVGLVCLILVYTLARSKAKVNLENANLR